MRSGTGSRDRTEHANLGKAEQLKEASVDAAIETAQTHLRGVSSADIEALIRLYYRRVSPQDIAKHEPTDLLGAAIGHWGLGSQRSAGEALVRVFNPNSEEDGWNSSHTTINVVTDDSPFIVDSVLSLLESNNIHVHLLAHPIIAVTRDDWGSMLAMADPAESDGTEGSLESYLHIEIDRITSSDDQRELQEQISTVLRSVRCVVQDWKPMREKALAIACELDEWEAEEDAGSPRFNASVGTGPGEVAELLRWMEAGAFTFMGYREYSFNDQAAVADNDTTATRDNAVSPSSTSRPETGLGTLRQDKAVTRSFADLPEETNRLARQPRILNLTKANSNATVHRSVPLDYIGIKELSPEGKVIGERRFLGLFTSNVYSGRVQDIPVVREKVAELIRRADFNTGSHDRSRLLNVLQTYPRDELFQADIDCLEQMVQDVLNLRDRRQVSLLQRRDDFGRFLSCLVFVPRDRHSTDVRLEIERILMKAYKGTSVRFSTEISDSPLARLHLVIYTDPSKAQSLPELSAVESRLNRVIKSWNDDLRIALVESNGEESGLAAFGRYCRAFSASYRSDVPAESAVADIARLDALDSGSVDVRLHRTLNAAPLQGGRTDAAGSAMRCKLYCDDKPVTLTQFIPLLHDLGATVIDERPYEVRVDNEQTRYIYDIGIEVNQALDAAGRERVREAVLAVWTGKAESDNYANLITTAELGWRDVLVLRAYSRYLLQVGSHFSQSYVMDTLNQNPRIASLLIGLFTAKFHPQGHSAERASQLSADVLEAIDKVESLDADQILRSFVSLISATKRTNHWQTPARPDRAALALKLDPRTIPGIPKPVPLAEVFVYGPRTEGVHLRTAKVARGGLRWSDRMEDFRTEILGLMKAQSVKNSVIVPAGAKGGFIAKQLPTSDRDTVMAEVVACYEIFIGALLDITDNLVEGKVVPPIDVVRHDEDDPYLVVAADKGTATFSDIANGIAAARGFWLDDAFASGGSVGYDHKALAITARGAWVSVERHFRDLDLDVSNDEFTVVGIGDMSGDVFGNGLLRSDKARLVAAFDHRNIFIDPSPDAGVSFVERQRLFDLPRSSWENYNTGLISEGGAVFSRNAKSIELSPEVVQVLDLPSGVTTMTPNELMQAILLAPVDLLWNGGIGTYAKASTESNTEVGDRNNDSIRVDGSQLRCRVVGEGGNLGFTQQARIEYALNGGHINTDAIDNAGGVDCSDHEVNLKILMAQAEADGDITRKQRDDLLGSLADEVCDHVLASNYAQTGALAVANFEAAGMVAVHDRLMDYLKHEAGLDRELEGLPTTVEMVERASDGKGLTQPELAVLMAYTKNLVAEQLRESDLPLSPSFDQAILDYFPKAVTNRFPVRSLNHPLRNELVATLVANDVVNRGGITMTHRLVGETSATVADIATAHTAAWQIYDLAPIMHDISSLDSQVPAEVQTITVQEVIRLGERATRWLLRNESQPLKIDAVVGTYRDSVEILNETLADEESYAMAQAFIDTGVPEKLAHKVAMLGKAFGSLDLANVASQTNCDLERVAAIHASIDLHLDLPWLRRQIVSLPRDDHWQTLARSALRDEFFFEHAEVTSAIATWAGADEDEAPNQLVEHWLAHHAVSARRCRQTFGEIQSAGDHDLAQISVALRALRQLSRAR